MGISLDDVHSILHIPIGGKFFQPTALSREEAVSAMRTFLGVSEMEARREVDVMNGPYTGISWLREVAEEQLVEGHIEFAARAFLLRILGCTLFADKSARYVRCSILGQFDD
jgi:hypothetical protein